MGELEAERIGFQSVTESIETTTPSGKLVFRIIGALAEFERNLIRERTSAGLAASPRQEQVQPHHQDDGLLPNRQRFPRNPLDDCLSRIHRISLSAE
jgi:DNA invertase Pin-like site-specific DNA recombinase